MTTLDWRSRAGTEATITSFEFEQRTTREQSLTHAATAERNYPLPATWGANGAEAVPTGGMRQSVAGYYANFRQIQRLRTELLWPYAVKCTCSRRTAPRALPGHA